MPRMQTRQVKLLKAVSSSVSMKQETDTSEYSLSESDESEKHKQKTQWSLKGLSCQILDLSSQLGETTYKELASILVNRLHNHLVHLQDKRKEIQNLKRRVYDAINVMVALGVLSKERKKISFIDSHKVESLVDVYEFRAANLKHKKSEFISMTKYFQAHCKLVERNKELIVDQTKDIKHLPLLAVSVKLEENELVLSHPNSCQLKMQSMNPINLYTENNILSSICK